MSNSWTDLHEYLSKEIKSAFGPQRQDSVVVSVFPEKNGVYDLMMYTDEFEWRQQFKSFNDMFSINQEWLLTHNKPNFMSEADDKQYSGNVPIDKGLTFSGNDTMHVPCPTCNRVGRVPTVLLEQTADSEVCKSCHGQGWIIVDKYKYLKNRP